VEGRDLKRSSELTQIRHSEGIPGATSGFNPSCLDLAQAGSCALVPSHAHSDSSNFQTSLLRTFSSFQIALQLSSSTKAATSSPARARYQAPLSTIPFNNSHFYFSSVNLLLVGEQHRQGQSFQMALFIISWPWEMKAARMTAAMGDDGDGGSRVLREYASHSGR
jgi:hypothetical protein